MIEPSSQLFSSLVFFFFFFSELNASQNRTSSNGLIAKNSTDALLKGEGGG